MLMSSQLQRGVLVSLHTCMLDEHVEFLCDSVGFMMICVVVLVVGRWVFFFFFKQKTAYEMRISDWSSDVCSSDLLHAGAHRGQHRHRRDDGFSAADIPLDQTQHRLRAAQIARDFREHAPLRAGWHKAEHAADFVDSRRRILHDRSEEHTSELQSLMRISYAVFCLTKTKHTD